MKMILRLTLSVMLLASLSLRAATFADSAGQSVDNDDSLIAASGIPLAVVQSVQSNSLVYIASAKASGAPRIDSIWVRPDSLAGTIGFYVATNTWTVASNAATGTNFIWITSTNAGMATNDLLVFQDVANDAYQLAIVSGNATGSSGLGFTNAAGYNAFKIFNPLTNAPLAGDKVFKMALVQSFTLTQLTNASDSAWLPLGSWWAPRNGNKSLGFSGPIGKPSAVVLTYSNAANLYVTGDYYVRPRR